LRVLFQSDTAPEWITDIVWTDVNRSLQESNLTAGKLRRMRHHVMHLILQTPLP